MPAITEKNLFTSESLRTTELLGHVNAINSVSTWSSSDHSRQAVGEAFKRMITELEQTSHAQGEPLDADAFFVADLHTVYRQLIRWHTKLPRVQPFYAVKCNPDPHVLALLNKFGTGFDCASKGEIEQVLNMGVPSEKIVYANPCKAITYIRYSAAKGIDLMTFDNADELYKVKQHHPNARLLLRISTDDSGSLCRLSLKFGASLEDTGSLLDLAKSLDLNVVGVSFHVGSGSYDPSAFLDAIRRSRFVFDQGLDRGFKFDLLDIGGGFSSDTFDSVADLVRPALDTYFDSSVRIISEPGRFFVAGAFTLAVNVIAKRKLADEEKVMYYVNDGVYGSLNCILFDHQHPVARVLKKGSQYLYNTHLSTGNHHCSIWGPTCDSLDAIASDARLPYELNVGDWIYFDDAGAYTVAAASCFNGFKTSRIVYLETDILD
ncbi:ornithine decarboxylase Spe1 [Schizosaccharomyces osmophilus]|uniref:ornithine decarboxylase n=1 Tax=Schizosaccharomyces osmophilus TaxID=2545709 RepID=A0AAE9WDE1_9SCHI|nr:ornithine decarboxylase Spe1 [Schizosaccharomyces osmophilus]WBW74306.1 ornithine decarboxylase Spe1 [Schizosaccharomyces osmophilus]